MGKRTDLALEAKELWEESADKTTQLSGVRAREQTEDGVRMTHVEILDAQGAAALNKPLGTYLTVEMNLYQHRERAALRRTAQVLGKQLRKLMNLQPGASVLVACLGNRSITPDAVGPKVHDQLIVTRHLLRHFSGCRAISAIAPGVLGLTGIETAEIIHSIVQKVHPDRVLVVDALASRKLERVCTTIQLTDTGISPGSGIGNQREALNEAVLGVPVTAIGVPTVVDLDTLLQGCTEEPLSAEQLRMLCGGQQMIVAPRDIDAGISRVSQVMAYGINLGLLDGMDMEDIALFLE